MLNLDLVNEVNDTFLGGFNLCGYLQDNGQFKSHTGATMIGIPDEVVCKRNTYTLEDKILGEKTSKGQWVECVYV